MGHQRAFELLVMGEPFTADRAREAGFVNHVVPPEALESTALAAAEALAAKPREAVRIARRLLKGDPAPVRKPHGGGRHTFFAAHQIEGGHSRV